VSDELEIGDALDRPRERVRAQAGGYLTVPEVADLARCEHKAVRRAIATGQLVAFQPAQKLLVREVDARAWIESRPVRARVQQVEHARRLGRQPRPGSVADLREMEREARG
jgi:hypothetical protein